MTNRERVINAINHKESDKLPYQFSLCIDLYEKVSKVIDIKKEYDNTCLCLSFSYAGAFEEVKKGHFKDEFGVVWNKTIDKDIGVVENCMIPDPDNYLYKFPEINEPELKRRIEYSIKEGREKGKFIVFAIGFSMFERAWTLRGMENILMDMIDNPEFLHKLMSDITEYNLKCMDIALKYNEIDAMMFGDDWGQQKGLIMGAGYWREFIKPYMKIMYQHAKNAGKYIIQHSCGDINEIFPDLIEIGLNVYQTFQPEIYDIIKVKKEIGDKITFWGGISTQHLLPFVTPKQLREEILRIIKILGRGGGYILAPTHDMPRDIPVENVLMMIDTFKKQK